jgi:predicted peroxiredoxin
MARLLVHLVSGPEHPTRAALAFLVAKTAAAEGHEVCLFLAGDAVQLARAETAEAVQGIGTGFLREHWAAVEEAGIPVYLSGLSSKARGVDAGTRSGTELAPPEKLIELATWAETTLTY